MAKIIRHTPEHKTLLKLIVKIGDILHMEEKHEVLIGILINTTEKLEAFQKWIEEHMDGDELTVDEIDIMNEVSRIDRAYGSAILEEEEFLEEEEDIRLEEVKTVVSVKTPDFWKTMESSKATTYYGNEVMVPNRYMSNWEWHHWMVELAKKYDQDPEELIGMPTIRNKLKRGERLMKREMSSLVFFEEF